MKTSTNPSGVLQLLNLIFLEKDTMDVWVNGTVLDTAVSFYWLCFF